MVDELFKLDEAFLSVDLGSQGPLFEWARPATNEVVTVDVAFKEYFKFLGLTDTGIRPPASKGEGFQPIWMFLESIDIGLAKLLEQIGYKGMGMVKLVGGDAQQHGICLLNTRGKGALSNLDPKKSLKDQIGPALAFSEALTWQTGNTQQEREEIEQGVGLEKMLAIAGSGAPLRYSGTTLRWVGKNKQEAYRNTRNVHLIESLLGAIISGNIDFPVSWGGACGTGLWDYNKKQWSGDILAVASRGLQGGREKFERILPDIATLTMRYPISPYFEKYDLKDVEVVPFVGDNPASRMLVPPIQVGQEMYPGNLVSIATSITVNLGQKEARHDPRGNLLLMYDYKGDPFLLACKSCGTGEWDSIKKQHNVGNTEQDVILKSYLNDIAWKNGDCAAREILFSYSKKETFPEISVAFQQRVGSGGHSTYRANKEIDVRAVIESGLADIAVHAKDFLPKDQPVYVMGGATGSEQILRMFAAMLNRDLIVCEESTGGAAHGSNIALQMLYAQGKALVTHEQFVGKVSEEKIIKPEQTLVNYYHKPGGYLGVFKNVQSNIIKVKQG